MWNFENHKTEQIYTLLIHYGIKAHDCIMLIEQYREKFGNPLKYKESDSQKLKDIRTFLIQCNEAYIIRKHYLQRSNIESLFPLGIG